MQNELLSAKLKSTSYVKFVVMFVFNSAKIDCMCNTSVQKILLYHQYEHSFTSETYCIANKNEKQEYSEVKQFLVIVSMIYRNFETTS